ncbi:hypothetical protein OROGR_003450 [Orobanche gracilis]
MDSIPFSLFGDVVSSDPFGTSNSSFHRPRDRILLLDQWRT